MNGSDWLALLAIIGGLVVAGLLMAWILRKLGVGRE